MRVRRTASSQGWPHWQAQMAPEKMETIMKTKYVLITVFAMAALGLAIHRGFTQSPPVVVGPGIAPNVQTPPDPNALKYYGGYYEQFYDPSLYNAVANPYNVFFGANDIP